MFPVVQFAQLLLAVSDKTAGPSCPVFLCCRRHRDTSILAAPRFAWAAIASSSRNGVPFSLPHRLIPLQYHGPQITASSTRQPAEIRLPTGWRTATRTGRTNWKGGAMAEFLWNAANFAGNFDDPTQWTPLIPGTDNVPGPTDFALYSENSTGFYLVNVTASVDVGANIVDDAGGTPLFLFDSGGTMTTGGFDFETSAGMLILPGGKLDVTSALTAVTTDTISITGDGPGSGGTLELANSSIGAAGSNITFTFSNIGSLGGGIIQFDTAGTTTTQTITGVGLGNEFIIGGHNFTGDTVNYSGTTLTVMNGGSTVFTMDNVTAAADPTQAFAIVGTNTIEAVCFFAGTMIACPDGERAVETLSIGDQVLTSEGRVMPVRWIGRNTVSTKFADPLRVLPIRIKAGALADHLPVRDLLVSPEHAVLVDDILVQAGALVNGLSIVRESNVAETFVYYHIELAEHALVLAEGTPAESFVDNIHRMAFDNWEEHEALYGDAPIVEMDYPRARSHRQVPMEIRARLLDRAATMPALQKDIAA